MSLKRIRTRGGAIAPQILALCAVSAVPASIQAQEYFQPNDLLPSSIYRSHDTVRYTVPAVQISMRMDKMQVLDGRIHPPYGGQADSFFDVFVELTIDVNGVIQPGTATGHSRVHMMDSGPLGGAELFDTEMIQLDLSGNSPFGTFMLRESPTQPSTGPTTVRPGNGGYLISSFFDVFTELSIDGGQTWSPGTNSARLVGSPEPATLAVLGLGAIALLRKRKRTS